MAQQDDKFIFSKKDQRDVSPFIGHELLYDYLSGNLDKERKSAVEDHVKFSRDAQLDLAKIQNGQTYAEKLSNTVVSQPIINLINTPSNYFSVLLQKSNFDKWPQGLKWGLEALVVVLAIVTLLTLTPWERVLRLGEGFGSKEVILAEVTKSDTGPAVEEKPDFVDEDVNKTLAVPTEATKPTVPANSKPEASPVQPTTAQSESPAETSAPAVTGGFLYRGEIEITNIETVGPKVMEKITELGGRKAGSVELGWKKTPTSMYYHFTIPEAKYQDFISFLSTYGNLKVGKEKHPRVMPDGIVRMIITVDEAKK